MGWYDAIKDGIAVAQKADNVPLVQSLIEAQKQILDLINENNNLKQEIQDLKKIKDTECRIDRHKDAVITLKGDEDSIFYCSNCWDTKQQLVQVQTEANGQYYCPACKTNGYYDKAKYDRIKKNDLESMNRNLPKRFVY